jgi:hypothetical protein
MADDDTEMTPQEFDEMVARGELVETVGSEDEYLAWQARPTIQLLNSLGDYAGSGPQAMRVNVASGPPSVASVHPTYQRESQSA